MNTISEVTRRDIIDYIVANKVGWWGRMDETAFLSRLYDLEKLPSRDNRFRTASRDIWQHCINNYDWENDWVFYDDRFNLMRGPDADFVKFLCEMVHPVVRSDSTEITAIVGKLNSVLTRDGWELFEQGQISDRPVYGARKIGQRIEIFELPTGWPLVDRQMAEVRLRLHVGEHEEEFQAVGLLCREALISVAQAVYSEQRYPPPDGVEPSATDAKRMLDAFLAVELAGQSNNEARHHAKAALALALSLQHSRTADFRTAAICAEATASVINLVGVLSGARVPAIQKIQ